MSIGAVALRQVDDQVRERGLEQADHAPQVVGRDQRHVFQLHRPRQQVQARGVLGQRSLEQREVEPRDVLGDVDQRVVGNRVEEHVGVAQAQVEVDQGHGVSRIGRQDAAQVDGQAGRADAAGGAGHGDHGAAASLAVAAAETLVADALQRRHQVFDPHRLRQELLDAGPHRPQDQVAVGRRADDDDAALGRGLVQLRDELQGLFRIVIERDDADVGMRLGDDVGRRTRSASTRPRARPCPCPSSVDLSASREASTGSTMANRSTLLMVVSTIVTGARIPGHQAANRTARPSSRRRGHRLSALGRASSSAAEPAGCS